MKFFLPSSKDGFVFIELVLVLGIVGLFLGIVILNILNIRVTGSTNSTVATFTTDFKNQQIKAMVGDSEGRGVPDAYSISIQPSGYVLFHGVTYTPSDATNFTIPLDTSLQMSTTFADNKIVFASNSGEIVNFIQGQNTVSIENTTTGERKTLQINKYGVITSSN